MFSSGDAGVGDNNPDPATQKCFTNDGKNTTQFIPSFPAGCVMSLVLIVFRTLMKSLGAHSNTFRLCPLLLTDSWVSVTTVGGTVNIPEIAVTRFFSGGGFSNYVRSPLSCDCSYNDIFP